MTDEQVIFLVAAINRWKYETDEEALGFARGLYHKHKEMTPASEPKKAVFGRATNEALEEAHRARNLFHGQ